jgi:hypothetical protein
MIDGIIFVAVVGYSASFISFLSVIKWIGYVEEKEREHNKTL